MFVWSRRAGRKNAAFLEAAGFTQVPDESGRLRHVPPGDEERPAGHGNPFAGGRSRQRPPHTEADPAPFCGGDHRGCTDHPALNG
ncbi:hypothetical protein [Streptomyces sp. NPDC058548]|uniref:hypothetical protein n=1 Tax=Streptomyces sp. NPDC058548 TaxID=3346545 RepID=UPI003656714F